MKKLIALAIAAMFILSGFAALAENGTLKMCTNAAFPPYEFYDENGDATGIDVEIAKAIAAKLGYDLEIVDIEFAQCIPGVQSGKWMPLTSLCYLPVTVIAEKHRQHWNKSTLVIPEYAYAFECTDEVTLSDEHTEYAWLPYEEAVRMLQWDSNRTALYELHHRLTERR